MYYYVYYIVGTLQFNQEKMPSNMIILFWNAFSVYLSYVYHVNGRYIVNYWVKSIIWYKNRLLYTLSMMFVHDFPELTVGILD